MEVSSSSQTLCCTHAMFRVQNAGAPTRRRKLSERIRLLVAFHSSSPTYTDTLNTAFRPTVKSSFRRKKTPERNKERDLKRCQVFDCPAVKYVGK